MGDRFAGLATSEVSDALDRCGIAGQCAGIRPFDRTLRFAGPAFTVRYGPIGSAGGTVGDFVDDVPAGAVPVLDNRGRVDTTIWGDLLTTVAARRGLAGTVIDGVCRDVGRSLELGYPLFARASWMRTGKDRVRVEEIGGPVVIGGVQVHPGDVVVGDADGVVVVPGADADRVAALATAIRAAEDEIRAAIERGEPLRSARARTGYHRLQTRDSQA